MTVSLLLRGLLIVPVLSGAGPEPLWLKRKTALSHFLNQEPQTCADCSAKDIVFPEED
jgi:hypothetical protein